MESIRDNLWLFHTTKNTPTRLQKLVEHTSTLTLCSKTVRVVRLYGHVLFILIKGKEIGYILFIPVIGEKIGKRKEKKKTGTENDNVRNAYSCVQHNKSIISTFFYKTQSRSVIYRCNICANIRPFFLSEILIPHLLYIHLFHCDLIFIKVLLTVYSGQFFTQDLIKFAKFN